MPIHAAASRTCSASNRCAKPDPWNFGTDTGLNTPKLSRTRRKPRAQLRTFRNTRFTNTRPSPTDGVRIPIEFTYNTGIRRLNSRIIWMS